MVDFSRRSGRRSRPRPCQWLVLVLAALLMLGLALPAWAAPATSVRTQAAAYSGLDDPDPAVRARTVQAIREAKDKNAVPALLAHIEDPDGQTGLYITQAIVELATREQLTPLLLLTGRGNTDGRWRAAYVLGQRKDSRALPSLAMALHDDEVLVTRTAAEALAEIGSTSAIGALMDSLQSARPSQVHAAKWGLLTLGDAAVPALAAGLESGIPEVEYSVSVVLEAIDTPAARAVLQPDIQ